MSTESHGFIAMTILYCLKCFNCKSSLFCPVYYDALDRMTTLVRISTSINAETYLALLINKVIYCQWIVIAKQVEYRGYNPCQPKTSEGGCGWETSFMQALLLRAEGWRPSDRKSKHLTPLVGRFYAKTACQMLACSTIQYNCTPIWQKSSQLAASNVLRSCGDVDDGQGVGRWMKQYLM